MSSRESTPQAVLRENQFSPADVIRILRENQWLNSEPSLEQAAWCERAATYLGPHCKEEQELKSLLALIFHYDPKEVLTQTDSHVVLSRYAARDVLRQLALQLLDGNSLTPERFHEVVTVLKASLDIRGRELFHPLRLALAGRSGEGDLDRVILLLDEASVLRFSVPVKSARARIVEFCSVFV